MVFYARMPEGFVITDNYTSDEIAAELHIRNLVKDTLGQLKKGRSWFLQIYNENNKLVKKLKVIK